MNKCPTHGACDHTCDVHELRAYRASCFVNVILLVPIAAPAESPTGISGTVLDAATHRPLPAVAVVFERQDGSNDSVTIVSTKRGDFVRLGLQPGRYAVSASVGGQTATCRLVDVASGQMRRVEITVAAGERDVACTPARPAGDLVDPDETADVYRIR